jgi:hypothetical protein
MLPAECLKWPGCICCICTPSGLANPHTPQLHWVLRRRQSYLQHRVAINLAQRLRWLIFILLISVTTPSARELLHPLPWSDQGGTGTWRSLASVIGFFVWPPIFVLLVHTLSFRLQLLLVPFTVLHYLLLGLPFELEAVAELGLHQVVEQSCRVFYTLLDPTFMLQAPDAAPVHCATNNPGFFLVYTYVVLTVVLPAQLLFLSEYWHKVAFLRARQAEGGALGAAAAAAATSQRWRWAPSLLTVAVSAWASCVLAWSAVTVAYCLVPWASRLRLRLGLPAA